MESETITPSTQDSEDEDRIPSETLSSMPTPYSGVVSRDLFSEPSETSHKRPKVGKPDQMKAFDRVDHDFLMRVLSKFGFRQSFCHWVSIFYSNVFSRIICNGNF